MHPTAHVPLPEFTVDAHGTARSLAFDDVYFSQRGGAAETEHVFLRGNGLPERWQGRDFTIAELGFGTGLNFLTTARAHAESGGSGQLHYLAIEKFPPTRAQLAALFAGDALAEAFLAQYPLRLPGLHRITLGRVRLTLAFGDIAALLPQLQARVDAWFLDGFAPAKNPAMWSDDVFAQMARLSAPGATLATFTVAGHVRRGLQAAGFAVEKTKGFAFKREMLVGQWHSAVRQPPTLSTPPTALVVGAGIAGCSVAHALATRGVRVTLVDAQGVAQAASGNRAAVLYPQLTKYYGPATEWHLAAYGYVLRLLAQLGGVEYASPGMLKIAKDDADAARLAAIAETLQLDDEIAQWVSAEEGSARVGTPVAQPGFWFAQGTWLSPRSLCARLVDHPNITPHIGTVVEARATTLTLADGAVLEAAGVVLAGAMGVQKFLPHLPMAANAGQVSEARSDAALNAILCHKGYAISPAPGALLIGATYTRDDLSDIVREEAHAHNRAELAVAAPALEAGLQITGGRVSLRATTPRRVPYVGRCGAMWVSAGHGSRGMLSAPLAAEVIAAAWCGEPMPVTQAVQALLQPPVPA